MTEDIFAIKELREIILAFPQHTPGSQDPSNTRLPKLLNAASGDALLLTDQLRKRILAELQGARQRLVLSTLAQQLDIGSRDLLSLLSEPEARPRWCYNTGIHSIVPQAELISLLQTLCENSSREFVNYQDYCDNHDLNPTDFRDYLRRFNESRHDRERLGIGRWYHDSETQSKATDYVYFGNLLDSARSDIRERLHQATEGHQSIELGPDIARGLDGASFQCLAQKVLEELFDFNHDFLTKCTLMNGNDHVAFTPPSALVAEKQLRLQQFVERSNGWRSSGKPAAEHLPCLPLWTIDQPSSESIQEIFSEARKIINEIDPSEKLIRLGDYTVTFRALRTLADQVLTEIEATPSVYLSIPNSVERDHKDIFLNRLYDAIVTEFSTDDSLIARIDQYISLNTSIGTARRAMAQAIEQQAQKAWQDHSAEPASIPYPEAAPPSTLLDAATIAAPAGQTGFYEAVARLGPGVPRKKDPAQAIWKSAVTACEGDYEARFAAAYSSHVLSRLNLYVSGLKILDTGKLRTELAALLVDYLVASYLADTLRNIRDTMDLKPCGRHVEPAIIRVKGQLASYGERSQDPEEDIEKFSTLLQACGAKFKGHQPKTEQLKSERAELEKEALVSAGNRKTDKDGSRAFLCVVLVLWARNNDGFLFASGRFVPRVLKLLKGKVNDVTYARLQELKDMVKSGSMSDEERNELLNLVAADEGV